VREQGTNFTQSRIAYVAFPEGKLFPVTHDTNSYSYLSVAANGKALATVLSESRWNIFAMPASAPTAQGRTLIAAEAGTNFTWTRDGFIVSDQNGALNRIDPATGAKTAVATQEGKLNGNPNACADGRYLLFDVGLPGGDSLNNVWRIDSAGGNLKQLSHGKSDNHAVCSSDSRWVYYIESKEEGTVARVPIDGGPTQSVSNLPISDSQFDVSPDGKLVAFATLEHSGEHKERLAVVDTDSRQAKIVDFERLRFGLLRFSPDGKAVVYPAREGGVDNLWQQSLDGSKGRQITDFTSERIYDFHWSFDSKQLGLVRGHTEADVVLIRQNN
jgi:Tol biopolymer transport system component